MGPTDCLLTGWYKEGKGADPATYKPESKLGGKKGLQALGNALAAAGDTLTLQTDVLLIQDESLSGSLVRRHAARDESRLVIASSDNRHFLFSPRNILERFLKLLNPIRSLQLPGAGIQLDGIGEVLYGDYSKNATTLRGDTKTGYLQIMEEGKRDGLLTVTGGNAYTYAAADRILDIPMTSSGSSILDETVPFLQLVLHGNIGYASTPGNLFNNRETEFLKWVEYGCLPYYRLTYASAVDMRYTTSNMLYSSKFEQWEDDVAAVYSRLEAELGEYYKAQMLSHTKLADGVYRTVYDNGLTVYVNYTQEAYDAGAAGSVPAGDFLASRI